MKKKASVTDMSKMSKVSKMSKMSKVSKVSKVSKMSKMSIYISSLLGTGPAQAFTGWTHTSSAGA